MRTLTSRQKMGLGVAARACEWACLAALLAFCAMALPTVLAGRESDKGAGAREERHTQGVVAVRAREQSAQLIGARAPGR